MICTTILEKVKRFCPECEEDVKCYIIKEEDDILINYCYYCRKCNISFWTEDLPDLKYLEEK